MHKKVEEVLDLLGKSRLGAFEDLGNNTYLFVPSKVSDFGHQIFINLEVSSDVLRVLFTYVFGIWNKAALDSRNLLDAIITNKNSFRGSSFYLTAFLSEGDLIACLEKETAFMLKWTTEDIVDMLDLQYTEVYASLIYAMPSYLQRFGEEINGKGGRVEQEVSPEALLAEGASLCRDGRITEGIALFRRGLEFSPRPGTSMLLNHNIAYGLCMLSGIKFGEGARVHVKSDNLKALEESVSRWDKVRRIYLSEVKGTKEEYDFAGSPPLSEYAKTASSYGFAISVRIDEYKRLSNGS